MTDRYDIVIVGAGHNGLTAAFYLARAGLRTLVLERRELVGGACVTEEIAPGVRASTTSYIASMLRPEIVADLGLAERGLRMVPCEPGLQVVFEDRPVLPWWSTHERTAEEIRRISAHDADAFGRVTERLHELARSLQPFFLEEPPNLYATGWSKLREGRRLFRRFRHLSGDQLSDLVRFATGSLGEFVERHFESDEVRRLYLANNVYGMHAPPVPAGDRDRAPVPHALRRRAPHPGLQRPRDRRDGLDHAGDGVGGPRRRRRDPHERRGGAHRRPRRQGDGGHARGRDRDHGAHGASRTRTPSARSSA